MSKLALISQKLDNIDTGFKTNCRVIGWCCGGIRSIGLG